MGKGYQLIMQCKNCNNTFEGSFCNNCGQKANTHRLTIKHSVHEFLHSFTHVDKGLLYLILQMFKRPGFVAKEYIGGKRSTYFNPTQYLILAVAVSMFLSIKFTLLGPNTGTVNPEVYKHLSYAEQFGLQYNEFIYKYFNIMLFVAVPVMALFTRLFYRSSGYNYAENLSFNSLLGAQRTLILILMAPFFYYFKSSWHIVTGAYYLIWVVYFGWAFTQFYEGKKSTVIIKYVIMLLLFIPFMQILSLGIFYLFFFKTV